MNLYEIFINMYIQEVNHLVKKGLKAAYVNEEGNLDTIRGKLSISKQIYQPKIENIIYLIILRDLH